MPPNGLLRGGGGGSGGDDDYLLLLLRGTILNWTYGAHKNLCISLCLLTIFWSYLLWYPVIIGFLSSPRRSRGKHFIV